MAHNVWRKVPRYGTGDDNLLWVARVFHVPMTLVSCFVAAWAYNPAYLLVVAFDIMLCGCLVPLLAAVYMPGSASPNAGLLSTLCGTLLRLVLEFTLPKDGSLVAFGSFALNYGRALGGLPAFLEVDPPNQREAAGLWDSSRDTCEQSRMADWTGLDSLICPAFSLAVFMLVVGFEKLCPGIDLLYFVPKAWRVTQPLYPLDPKPNSDHGAVRDGANPVSGHGDRDFNTIPAARSVSSTARDVCVKATAHDVLTFGAGPIFPATGGPTVSLQLQGTLSGPGLHHRDPARSHVDRRMDAEDLAPASSV